jgi:hypothetical protein
MMKNSGDEIEVDKNPFFSEKKIKHCWFLLMRLAWIAVKIVVLLLLGISGQKFFYQGF